MNRALKTLASLLAIATVTVSIAAGTTATASWKAPTVYTDGSSLPASDIDHYTLTWAPAAGSSGSGPSGSQNVPAGTLTATVNVPCGSTSFTVAVTTTAAARFPSASSGPSSPVPYASGVACAPNPPTGLAVQ